MKFHFIHTYILNIIINLYAMFYIDIFYDNFTYIANTLHHPFYVALWTLSSLYGLYFYSQKIWNAHHLSYSKKLHSLNIFGMAFVLFIPYGTKSIFNDMHVWLLVIMLFWYFVHWILLYLNQLYELKIFLIILMIFFVSISWIGHVAAINEMLFSIGFNIYLHHWAYKKKKLQ